MKKLYLPKPVLSRDCGVQVLDSAKLLRSMGYDFLVRREPGVEPRRANVVFKDILPELCREPSLKRIAESRLYEHQLKALEALEKGLNVVLRAGTGSGKTEAWVMYFLKRASREDFRAVAVYPTLALANDQVRRITAYAAVVGVPVAKLDAKTREELSSSTLKRIVSESKLVITNPAFLLHQLKKLIIDPRKCLLHNFFSKLSLIVFDEIDFYSPRSLALLLAMIELLSMYSDRRLQVVVLTATLANPEDLCRFLKSVTGRDCAVIEGEPFRVENRIFIVLGKELERIWLMARSYLRELEQRSEVDPDVIEALKNFDRFRKDAYRVISYLRALGFEIPSPGFSVEEVVEKYVDDEGVTLVFTRSIHRAEELAKAIQSRLPEDKRKRVATHHHLVPKGIREAVEEGARRGEVKIIVSPRTLTQGIDIGTVVRVVHVGLPEDVREFLQREGRKGRRKEIPFTETIILPSSRWDWELLSKGFEALDKWLSLPLEKTIVNPRNKYKALFTALAKILSPWLRRRADLSEEEREVLKDVGVLRKSSIDEPRARRIWERMNFYEYGPPYGVKRYIVDKSGSERPLEPIGHCDLVERFQVGCFDLGNDAIVIGLRTGRNSRHVMAVIEKPLKHFSYYENDALAEAIEEYRAIKMRWGEEPSLLRDVARGKLFSYVHCVVYPPHNGFGELRKVPNRVVWLVSSEKPRVYRVGSKHVVTYDRKTIYVPVNTAGEYRDFTYGVVIETSEAEDATMLRLGLNLLMIVLRRVFGIPFETIMYGVERIGEKKFVELHEPEAAGLLETMDWAEVRKAVESYQPDDLDYVLMQMLDEIGYSEMLSLGVGWDEVKRAALRVVDYILLRERLRAEFRGFRLSIPRPSRALKLVALDVVAIELDKDSAIPRAIVVLSYFDGEECRCVGDMYIKIPFSPPPRELRLVENEIDDLITYEGFSLIVTDKTVVTKDLEVANLKKLSRIVENAISLSDEYRSLGIEPLSIPEVLNNVKIEGVEIKLIPLENVHKKIVDELRNLEYGESRGSWVNKVVEEIQRYLEARVRAIYIAHLVAQELSRRREK